MVSTEEQVTVSKRSEKKEGDEKQRIKKVNKKTRAVQSPWDMAWDSQHDPEPRAGTLGVWPSPQATETKEEPSVFEAARDLEGRNSLIPDFKNPSRVAARGFEGVRHPGGETRLCWEMEGV